jgi:hypothetical protein
VAGRPGAAASLLVYRLPPEGSRTSPSFASTRSRASGGGRRRAGQADGRPARARRLPSRSDTHECRLHGGSDAEPALVAVDLETIRLGGPHRRRLEARRWRGSTGFAWACDEERGFREARLPRAERRTVTPEVSVVMST